MIDVVVAEVQPLNHGAGFSADNAAAAILAADFGAGVEESRDFLPAFVIHRAAPFVGAAMAQFHKRARALIDINTQFGAKAEIVKILALEFHQR